MPGSRVSERLSTLEEAPTLHLSPASKMQRQQRGTDRQREREKDGRKAVEWSEHGEKAAGKQQRPGGRTEHRVARESRANESKRMGGGGGRTTATVTC